MLQRLWNVALLLTVAGATAGSVAGCASATRQFPLQQPLERDPDRRVFEGEPEEYISPFAWDAADQTIFRPITRFFAIDPAGEARNVNALDEVPDSSWFQNRMGEHPLTPDQLAVGPCGKEPTAPHAPWTVIGAKPNGANPGFIIEDANKKRYLVKFDGTLQGPRATAADVIVSKLYFAAGYSTPCNQVVFFEKSILRIDPDAKGESPTGEEEPLTMKHIERVLEKSVRLDDGRYRASTSEFLPGKPLGPFRYQGTRDDDPNDVVAHQDRRELRGMYVLAAWTNHFDSREQNTLDTWLEVGSGRGYVQHNVIDFGDCFGSIWEPPSLGRRIGHAYYLDFPYLAEDFLSAGLIRRPWDEARFGPSQRVFAYYDVDSFLPDTWRPGYPNPAFGRMSERDAAWMARIIAEFSDAHLARLVEVGRLGDAFLERELLRLLVGRRDKILRRYLTRLSPLTHPMLRPRGGKTELCLDDLATSANVARPSTRRHAVAAWAGEELRPVSMVAPRFDGARQVCLDLPSLAEASADKPEYLIVDVIADNDVNPTFPARVHLYSLGSGGYRVVGLERPDGFDAPRP